MKRSAVCLLMILAVLLSLCSCGKAPDPLEGSLTFYVPENDSCWTTAIERFDKAHKKVSVNVVTFESSAELEAQLQEDLENGTGPDVVMWSAFGSTMDMRRMAEKGYFLDLDEFLESDETFDRANYYEPVLDCGKIDGKQYVMTCAYTIPGVMAKDETVERTGIFDDGETVVTSYRGDEELSSAYSGVKVTMKKYLETVAAESERLAEDENSSAVLYGFSFGVNLGNQVFFSDLIDIDYENRTVTADKEKLHELADYCNIMKAESEKGEFALRKQINLKKKPDRMSFIYDEMSPAAHIAVRNLESYAFDSANPVFFGITGYDNDEGYVAKSALELAINKSSADPELAYAFVRSVMDGEVLALYEMWFNYQLKYERLYKVVPVGLYSVNKSRMSEYLKKTMTEIDLDYMKTLYKDELCPQMVETLEGISTCRYWSWNISAAVSGALTPYCEGEADFDSCYDDMMSRLEEYFEE